MSTLIRWEPFRELASLQSDLGRLMNGVLEGQARTAQSWVPALDVWETDREIVYAFDLPGVPEDKISIEVQDETLTVSAERVRTLHEDGDRVHRSERRYGTFSRGVGLPAGVDAEGIVATTRDGVLEIRVPKPAEARPRKIPVGAQPAEVEAGVA